MEYQFSEIKCSTRFIALRPSLATLFLRFAILRVHSHGLVTIDLQCYEEDNIAQLDNVGDFDLCTTSPTVQHVVQCCLRLSLSEDVITFFFYL